ncbi:Rz-like spanin [Serratia phage phiMAM1]|uniref:Uncharacterized protein n=1 Tax=Serratia phage phiMAM1 TaxID=1262513 RepID=K7YXY8_9CAUD|nr:Rz-like spanin [Serratia phage phiMAM1]AFX93565.1 hypothetical protein MAM_097 [Serratia phage phiMAM1]
MKRILLALLFITGAAQAAGQADDLHTCLAWFSTYEQFHQDDYDTGLLKAKLELEMKLSKVYNINQIENALDTPMMESAADKSEETKSNLRYCTNIAKDFIK